MSSEWRIVTVEEIAAPAPSAMATGPFGSSISAKHFVEAGTPVIRGSNLSADVSTRLLDAGLVFVSAEKAAEFLRSTVRRGDLIFTCWGTINQVGLIDSRSKYDSYVVSNKQMKLTVDRAKADARFIYYVFSGPDKQTEILDNGIGSSVPGFNLGQLKRHEVLLPSLPEQMAIADFLELLDDRITLLRETNATLEAIAQALFKSWFVDFDPVRAKMEGRAPEGMDEATAALFPDGLEESELGVVPRGWSLGQLNQFCSIASGKRPGERSDAATPVNDVPLFGGAGVMGYTSESLFDEKRILTGRVGTLGKVHIAHPPFWASDNVLVLLPNHERLFQYCFHWLSSIDVHALNRGSTQPLLTQRDLGRQVHVVPTDSVLDIFSTVTGALNEKLRVNADEAQTLATLRDTLLPRLISGQLRLPEAQALAAEA
jgi:type I restriction enzyme S subunit